MKNYNAFLGETCCIIEIFTGGSQDTSACQAKAWIASGRFGVKISIRVNRFCYFDINQPILKGRIGSLGIRRIRHMVNTFAYERCERINRLLKTMRRKEPS